MSNQIFKSLNFLIDYWPSFFLILAINILNYILGFFYIDLENFYTLLFSSNNLLITFFGLIKAYPYAFFINTILFIITLIFNAFAMNATIHIILNHETEKIKHITTNLSKQILFWLFLTIAYFVLVIPVFIFKSIIFVLLWSLLLFLITFTIVIRLFLTNVYIARFDEKISESVSKSWYKTKNYFWEIVLFFILAIILLYFVYGITFFINNDYINTAIVLITYSFIWFWSIAYMCKLFLAKQ